MHKGKKIIFFVLILGVGGVGSFIFFGKFFETPKTCDIQTSYLQVQGYSMEPLIFDTSILPYQRNYYTICNAVPEKGDIILYAFGADKREILKQIKATPKDTLKIEKNNLFINGEKMLNSAGEEYIFSQAQLQLLSLYIKEGKIPQNSFLIFGDNIKNSQDSRTFGAISGADIVGKGIID